MFADALDRAYTWTFPVIVSRRHADGTCRTAIGALVVINPDGWFLTSDHIVRHIHELSESAARVRERAAEEERIRADGALDKTARSRALKQLGRAPTDTVTRFSPWWGRDGLSAVDIVSLPPSDIALGRLEPWDAGWIQNYPAIVDTSQRLRAGTSLCRIGFPFHTFDPVYDQAADAFRLPPSALPIPFFPIEGILTRQIEVPPPVDGIFQGFIETSSPGLKGQSGGPIISRNGAIWGIQSRTHHLALGFNPPVPDRKPGEKEQKEHQFLNVGWGTHPATIRGLLDRQGIRYEVINP